MSSTKAKYCRDHPRQWQYLLAQKNKKNNESLSWAVPHSEINQTKNCPLLQYNRGPIMRQGGHMLQQENKENNIWLNWAVPHSKPNQKQKKMSPPKFTYSGRICRFAQFFSTKRNFWPKTFFDQIFSLYKSNNQGVDFVSFFGSKIFLGPK